MNEGNILPNNAIVDDFINAIEHPIRKKDSEVLLELIGYITDLAPQMWGESIVGYGRYHYSHVSGEQGEWLLTGFNIKEESLTVYLNSDFDRFEELLSQLGECKLGKACLHINKLSDIDIDVLSQLIGESVGYMRRKFQQ